MVIYCGCCPWEKCPNIAAAYKQLTQMGFTGPEALLVGLRKTIKFDQNVNTSVWWAGQWQDGDFHGLAPASLPGAREPVAPKPAWKPAK